ncbi:hypothetical protein RRG08_062271 [Elysia crispata]|uniref:Uncharacterized protein n=1 Tax=Elysia crispata TaxID=231223 RepID=A0AAE1CY20_9GAST|nr:hypothetical protein RRG08_062271 [Elysia crispata]
MSTPRLVSDGALTIQGNMTATVTNTHSNASAIAIITAVAYTHVLFNQRLLQAAARCRDLFTVAVNKPSIDLALHCIDLNPEGAGSTNWLPVIFRRFSFVQHGSTNFQSSHTVTLYKFAQLSNLTKC